MEGHCSTGQSPQWAVIPMEEEEEWMELYLCSSMFLHGVYRNKFTFTTEQPELSILFHLKLVVYHVQTTHNITVIPSYTSNQLHKFPLIQDAQIDTRFFNFWANFCLYRFLPLANWMSFLVPLLRCHQLLNFLDVLNVIASLMATRHKRHYRSCHCCHNFIVELGVVSVNHS